MTPGGGLDEARSACEPELVDGMYAAASSPSEHVLRLVRDPLGIKPLYVREAPVGVAVSSEVVSLLGAFGPASVRTEAFAQFLLTGRRVVDGGSFFEGIRPVAPGESMTLEAGEITASTRSVPRCSEPSAPAPGELRARFEEAVDRVLLSERPIGVALSGGLDSTILARVLARRGVRHMLTVSVCPEGTGDGVRSLGELGLNDGAVATWRHHWTPFGPSDLLDGLPSAVRAFGEPVAMTSVPMYAALAKLAGASGITVLLVGEGADELFAGYNRYVPLYAGTVGDPVDFYLSQERLKLVRELIGPDLAEAAADALRAAVGRSEAVAEQRHGRRPGSVEVVREFEYEHSLEPLLRRTDHLLMAEGIEGRTPFLHAGIPDLARRYPSSALVRGNLTKAVLREEFADLLPSHYREIAKQPFRAPVHRWFSGTGLPRMDSALAGATEPLYHGLGVLPTGVRTLRDRLAQGDPLAFTMAFGLLCAAEWISWLEESPTGEEEASYAGR
ncbi:asparagine synthetase B family protein [Nocardiopsis sp. LOL_012]|uniref:asparagine synthetase B family protein n=1 Tax=Nocardiopsis sp. LOL_012 TaxID=3345409 RepID=UPI003A8419BE